MELNTFITNIGAIATIFGGYIVARHKIKPNIKATFLTDSQFYDLLLIEIKKQSHGFVFQEAKIICEDNCQFYAFGKGVFDDTNHFQQPYSRQINFNYWIDPEFSDKPSSDIFWFTMSKKTHRKRGIRFKFHSIKFPYKSSCYLPLIDPRQINRSKTSKL